MRVSHYAYEIYDDGRIFSHYKNDFLKPSITRHGYYYVVIPDWDGVKRAIRVHQLVAYYFCPRPDNWRELCVNHIDGNKLNNHASNLEWVTYGENNIHAIRTGLRDVAMSNSKRWDDEQFRSRVSSKISKTQKERKVSADMNNPRFRYVIMYQGRRVTRKELVSILGKSQSRIDTAIREAGLNGKRVKLFERNGIVVTDIKDKCAGQP